MIFIFGKSKNMFSNSLRKMPAERCIFASYQILNKMRYLLLAPLLFLMSCSLFKSGAEGSSTKQSVAVSSLSGSSWALDSLTEFTMESDLKKPVTLIFSDTSNDVFGFGGCNGFSGHFAQNKSELHFSQLLSTKMYCVTGSKTETRLTYALLNCDHAAIDSEGHLLLMKGKELLAIFRKYIPKSE